MPKLPIGGVGNPLQMVAFYLAWVESAIVAAIFAVGDSWLRILLVVVVVIVALSYAGIVVYINLYILHKKPYLFYNPSDYAPEVQQFLFPNSRVELKLKDTEVIKGGTNKSGKKVKSD